MTEFRYLSGECGAAGSIQDTPLMMCVQGGGALVMA